MTRDEIIEQQNAYYMAGYPSRRSENKINNEEKKSSKNNLPDIDVSKYNIDKNGNVFKYETLIRPWQQNMLDLLEKNECLEEEKEQLKEQLKQQLKNEKQLTKRISELQSDLSKVKSQIDRIKECYFNSCLGCTNKICEVKK